MQIINFAAKRASNIFRYLDWLGSDTINTFVSKTIFILTDFGR